MNYRFLKIKRGDSTNWYFHPRTEEQLLEHFHTVVGSEIRDGLKDYVESSLQVKDNRDPRGYVWYHAHPTTPWRRAVEGRGWICYESETWLEASCKLEHDMLVSRLRSFRLGQEMFLDNGLIETRWVPGDQILEVMFKDSLEFPPETHLRFEDVRYMRWDMPDLPVKGTHWYAKLGHRDIVDKDGNMKWDTKEEAEAAAWWYVYNKIAFKRYSDVWKL